MSVGLAGQRRLDGDRLRNKNWFPRYVQRTEAEVKFDEQQGVSALERRRQRVASKLTQRRGDLFQKAVMSDAGRSVPHGACSLR